MSLGFQTRCSGRQKAEVPWQAGAWQGVAPGVLGRRQAVQPGLVPGAAGTRTRPNCPGMQPRPSSTWAGKVWHGTGMLQARLLGARLSLYAETKKGRLGHTALPRLQGHWGWVSWGYRTPSPSPKGSKGAGGRQSTRLGVGHATRGGGRSVPVRSCPLPPRPALSFIFMIETNASTEVLK